jgi:molybdate/tungstate transport system substrate-binding protein
MAHSDRAAVVHDETELLAQLESRAVDYAFLYRTTAEDHHLKMTVLPPEQSLSRLELADQYAAVSVDVMMKQGESRTHVVGAPVTYGLTIPVGAPHDAEARRFVAFVLGDKGTQVLRRRGFGLVQPARCAPCGDVPSELGDLVRLAR